MNPQWFGDSFDIVKRFFIENLAALGYEVVVDPMLTGEWNGKEESFYQFLKAVPYHQSVSEKTALLLDPDTGIGEKRTGSSTFQVEFTRKPMPVYPENQR